MIKIKVKKLITLDCDFMIEDSEDYRLRLELTDEHSMDYANQKLAEL